jgi:F-type H+-transporting ATPase subunit epsilon
MLPDKLNLEIATPDRLVISQPVDEVVLPSVEGYMGVLPGHAPLLARLDAGEIAYRVGQERRRLAVSGGFAEILRDGVQILAETCEPAEEIDIERARRDRERAEEQLRAGLAEHEFRTAEASLKRALARIRVHEQGGD